MTLIREIIKKSVKRFIGYNSTTNNSKYLEIDQSSILPSQIVFDFRTKKEDRKYVRIGKKCMVHASFIFESNAGEVVIGDNVQIGDARIICRTRVEIHNDVMMAWGITLYDHNSHSLDWNERKKDIETNYNDFFAFNGNTLVNKDWSVVKTLPIIIESKVWIGFNVVVLKGVRIGEGAIVAACSTVTRDVEPWTVVGGNPAVLIKKIKI